MTLGNMREQPAIERAITGHLLLTQSLASFNPPLSTPTDPTIAPDPCFRLLCRTAGCSGLKPKGPKPQAMTRHVVSRADANLRPKDGGDGFDAWCCNPSHQRKQL